MATARVKWWNEKKGFGFLTPDGGGSDVFVHHSVLDGKGHKNLREGETVEYEAEEGPKGMKATKVTRAGGKPTATAAAAQ